MAFSISFILNCNLILNLIESSASFLIIPIGILFVASLQLEIAPFPHW